MSANILVVEDDASYRNLIAGMLRKEGYDVSEAGDGLEALELAKTRGYEIMITDFVMPNMDGLKLVEEMRHKSPRTRVIFITGYLSETSGKKILQEMIEFIPKPFELSTLRSTILRLL
jgi:two-component system, cell cycle sensor histidine kinase and response regulator CckA